MTMIEEHHLLIKKTYISDKLLELKELFEEFNSKKEDLKEFEKELEKT